MAETFDHTLGNSTSAGDLSLEYASSSLKTQSNVTSKKLNALRRVRRFDTAAAFLQLIFLAFLLNQILGLLTLAEHIKNGRTLDEQFMHGYGDGFRVVVAQICILITSLIALANLVVFLHGSFRFNSLESCKPLHWCFVGCQLLSLLFCVCWVVLATHSEPVFFSASCLSGIMLTYLLAVGFVECG